MGELLGLNFFIWSPSGTRLSSPIIHWLYPSLLFQFNSICFGLVVIDDLCWSRYFELIWLWIDLDSTVVDDSMILWTDDADFYWCLRIIGSDFAIDDRFGFVIGFGDRCTSWRLKFGFECWFTYHDSDGSVLYLMKKFRWHLDIWVSINVQLLHDSDGALNSGWCDADYWFRLTVGFDCILDSYRFGDNVICFRFRWSKIQFRGFTLSSVHSDAKLRSDDSVRCYPFCKIRSDEACTEEIRYKALKSSFVPMWFRSDGSSGFIFRCIAIYGALCDSNWSWFVPIVAGFRSDWWLIFVPMMIWSLVPMPS